MGLFKGLKKPKGKIELQLDEVAYDWKDKLTGRIAIDPQEEIDVDQFRIEIHADRKTNVKLGRFSSYRTSSSSSRDTHKIPVSGPIKLAKGQHHEQAFQIDIPLYRRDYFTEMPIKVKGVAAVKGRPDLTHEVEPTINLPYVIECLGAVIFCRNCGETNPIQSQVCSNCNKSLYPNPKIRNYGGCGFVTEPSMEPPKICPQCGHDMEEAIKRKYQDQMKDKQGRMGRRF